MSDVISDLKYIRFAMNYTCSVQEAKDAYEINGRDADKALAYLKEKYPPKKIMPAESIDKPKNNDKDKKFWTKKKNNLFFDSVCVFCAVRCASCAAH